MIPIAVKSRVGSDGVLQVNLSMGPAHAHQEVQVMVEDLSQPAQSQEDWCRGILETAGKWEGEFERPDQGEYEQREPLS
jgi:hypothetical protein